MTLFALLSLTAAFAQEEEPRSAPAEGDEVGAEITVEAQAPGARTLDDPTSVTIIEVDERLSAAADLADVIETATGTTVVQLGGLGDLSAVSIRGSSLRQVQVFLDGVPLNPDGSAVVNLSELPLQAFSRVEVYRGNAPPVFAAAPMGGVINLVSQPGAPTPRARASVGSYGTLQGGASGGSSAQRWGGQTDLWLIAEGMRTNGDFDAFSDNATPYNPLDDALGPRLNNQKAQVMTHARARYIGASGRVTLVSSLLQRGEGLPGPVESPAVRARLDTTRHVGVLEAERCGELAIVQARAFRNDRVERFDDRDGELGSGGLHQQSAFATTGLLLHGAWAPAPWVNPSLTLSGRIDGVTQTDLTSGQTDDPRRRLAGSAALALPIHLGDGVWELSPVLQAQALNSRAIGAVPVTELPIVEEGEHLLLAFTPRLGVSVQPTSWLALRTNAGRFLRAPDFTELFGERGAIQGNPTLLPERGVQADLGARAQWTPAWGGLWLDVAGFVNRAEDLIVLVQNAQRSSVPVNLGEARTLGAELALTVTVLDRLDSQTNLTWTRSESLVDRPELYKNQLPRVPVWELSQATSAQIVPALRVGHTWSYVDGNYWDATNFYEAAPRAIHGAFARVTVQSLSGEISVLNLTDRITQVVDRSPTDPTDDALVVASMTDFVGYPLAGRTLMFTLRWAPEGPEETQ